jgi:hypothetical protein
VIHDLPVGTEMQMGDAGKDEFDPLDLQAHGPLHPGLPRVNQVERR